MLGPGFDSPRLHQNESGTRHSVSRFCFCRPSTAYRWRPSVPICADDGTTSLGAIGYAAPNDLGTGGGEGMGRSNRERKPRPIGTKYGTYTACGAGW